MMSMESLESMYKNNFCLMESEIYTLSDLENMLPWERYIYINLYLKSMKEKAERMKKRRK
jgi:hypothetical protein